MVAIFCIALILGSGKITPPHAEVSQLFNHTVPDWDARLDCISVLLLKYVFLNRSSSISLA